MRSAGLAFAFNLIFCSVGWTIVPPTQPPLSVTPLSYLIESDGEAKIKVLEGIRVPSESILLASVVMVVNQETHEICTGSAIGSRTILTAAHCVTNNADQILILTGQDPLSNQSSLEFKIQDVQIFPSYDSSQKISPYDIAILHSYEKLDNFGLAPLKINFYNFAQPYIRVLGYGLGNDRAQTPSHESLIHNSVVLSDGILRTKKLKVEEGFESGTSFLIVSQPKGGLCNGDSGSPALRNNMGVWETFAIAHSVFSDLGSIYGDVRELCSRKARYLKLEPFRAWIQNNNY